MIFELNDIIQGKKKHPCGGDRWCVIRVGADYKIKCMQCNRVVMLSYDELRKITKQITKGSKENDI